VSRHLSRRRRTHHAIRRVASENPIDTSEWLMIGLGVLVLGGVGYALYSYAQGISWPPSATVQNGIVNSIMSANSQMGGSAPTAEDSAQLAYIVNNAPAAYAATLPPGTPPTVAGYEAWAPNYVLQQFGSPGAAS
jgi:hypothetical protein